MSPSVSSIVEILQTLSGFVDEIPLAPQTSRYGNLAYRTWHERMCCEAESFMVRLLTKEIEAAAVELVPYFTDSFGNSSRIDYAVDLMFRLSPWFFFLILSLLTAAGLIMVCLFEFCFVYVVLSIDFT